MLRHHSRPRAPESTSSQWEILSHNEWEIYGSYQQRRPFTAHYISSWRMPPPLRAAAQAAQPSGGIVAEGSGRCQKPRADGDRRGARGLRLHAWQPGRYPAWHGVGDGQRASLSPTCRSSLGALRRSQSLRAGGAPTRTGARACGSGRPRGGEGRPSRPSPSRRAGLCGRGRRNAGRPDAARGTVRPALYRAYPFESRKAAWPRARNRRIGSFRSGTKPNPS